MSRRRRRDDDQRDDKAVHAWMANECQRLGRKIKRNETILRQLERQLRDSEEHAVA